MLSEYKKILADKNELYLRIKVHPGSSSNEFLEILKDQENGDTIKMNIAAPPEKGKANHELVKFLAKRFKVKKENVKIISGAGSRIKLIKIKK